VNAPRDVRWTARLDEPSRTPIAADRDPGELTNSSIFVASCNRNQRGPVSISIHTLAAMQDRSPLMVAESASPASRPLSRTAALAGAGLNGREAAEGERQFLGRSRLAARDDRNGNSLLLRVRLALDRSHTMPAFSTVHGSASHSVSGNGRQPEAQVPGSLTPVYYIARPRLSGGRNEDVAWAPWSDVAGLALGAATAILSPFLIFFALRRRFLIEPRFVVLGVVTTIATP